MIKTEEKYGDKIKRSLKDRVVYQRCWNKACSYINGIPMLLQENLKLEEILIESNENQKTLAKTCFNIGTIYIKIMKKKRH